MDLQVTRTEACDVVARADADEDERERDRGAGGELGLQRNLEAQVVDEDFTGE